MKSDRVRRTVYLSERVDRALRMHCAERCMERSAAVEDAVALWLMTRDLGEAMSHVEAAEAWRRVGREIGALG